APTMQAPAPPPPVMSAPAHAAPIVRPPPGAPGGVPLYGTAMTQPTGFAASMAESVDDFGGARAVEIAAMLGDSVVGVKHCIDPKGGRVSPVTWAFFSIAIFTLLASGYSFYKAVDNAAWNKGQYEYLTQCLVDGKRVANCTPRPGFSVRDRPLWIGYDWVMFGGLALSLVTFTLAIARMRAERQSPFFRIGTG